MDRSNDCAVSSPGERIHRLEVTLDWPPGHAAAYLIDTPEPIVIDAGVPGERGRRELVAGLATHGYAFEDVSHLLLTHPHSDHIGQANAIIEEGNPIVYAPNGVRSRLSRSLDELARGVRETAHEVGLRGTDVEESVEDALSSLQRNRRLLPPEAIDVDLVHGQRFEVAGLDCEAIHTPGHQAEHICFYFFESGMLFGGDVLIEPFRAAALDVGLDREADDSFSHYYTAYDRLDGLAVDRVYPGHGPVFTACEDIIVRSRRDLDGTVERVHDTVAERAPISPLAATLAQLPEDPPHNRLQTTLLEILGALGHLEANARLTSALEDGVRHYQLTDS